MTHTEIEDRRLIGEVMQTYIEGAKTGSNDVLRPIFHDLATICGYVGDDLFAGPIQMFYDWHDENGPAESVQAGETTIDLQGTAASVRIELLDWTGHRFTDFFTLVKVEGRWQILSKVFFLHPEE
ncbi:nuclear transport factor 2 family protein [Halomonas denitrificans]|nr:nuclear transport factor 2 family protein [Halomonas denitrificans]